MESMQGRLVAVAHPLAQGGLWYFRNVQPVSAEGESVPMEREGGERFKHAIQSFPS